jgi:hypothetical protein
MPNAGTNAHHFILTLQRPNGITSTRAGVWTPPPGATREQALAQIVEAAFPDLPLSSVVVLFFSLAPNQL